ncbi:cupin domain-containing protein [Edaphobacter albus]|uniref:cupin domain-containing protein n=1 Tax=Edaphobacter sp. 4G125 TaxID=2763071 RepID=UPI001645EBF9|nr:cupin domain-containing protein [Edaphobacter sp. 4G125]QNI36631.1 cupin domain-containing protein [Edaphobacter sp. 4G125]
MNGTERWTWLLAVICYAPVHPYPAITQQAPKTQEPSPRSIVLSQSLPPLRGNNLQVQIVRVHYRPGESSPPHSHPCPVIGYVLEGSLRMQVKPPNAAHPGAVTIYRKGDSFYEDPNGQHLVSANASQSEPATFLATFICDHPTAVTVPLVHKEQHP